jgi:branched-chain amino acid transport system permease protein
MPRADRLRWLGWVALLAVAIPAPLVLGELQLFTASRIVIYGLWALSLNLLLGQTGLVSFAHAAFFGIGAYSVGLVSLHLGWSAIIGIPLSLAAGGTIALLMGLVALRAVHLYFSMLTLAISQLLFVLAFTSYDFTLGDNGIHGIELPSFLADTSQVYWFVVAVAGIGVLALGLIWRSPFGASLQAIRDNRLRAAFIGLHVRRYELAAFTVAGMFAALAGSLFAVVNRSAYPGLLDWTQGAVPIFIILIGGMFRFYGPIVGAIAYVLLEEAVTRETLYSNLVLGAIFLAIVLIAPTGITGITGRVVGRLGRRRAPALMSMPEPLAETLAGEFEPTNRDGET